jgi:hypothetical protein
MIVGKVSRRSALRLRATIHRGALGPGRAAMSHQEGGDVMKIKTNVKAGLKIKAR